jgi:hypothetical protein
MNKSSVSPGFSKQIIPVLRILCYNGSLVTWFVVSLTTAKFKPLILSVYGFALSYTANMCILKILYDFCLLPTQFFFNSIHTEGWKPCANRGSVCTLKNFQWCGETCFVGPAILRGRCLPLLHRRDKDLITDLISALWKVSLMLALKRSFFNREHILIIVLKALTSPYNPLIEDYTHIFYMIDKRDISSIQCNVSLRGPKSMRKLTSNTHWLLMLPRNGPHRKHYSQHFFCCWIT